MKKTVTPLVFSPKERGQGLVEVAISFVILVILASGIFNVGMGIMVHSTLTDATQEGANYASLAPTDTAGIEGRIRSFKNSFVDLNDTSKVTVTIMTPTAPVCAGKIIKVKVATTVPIIAPMAETFLGSNLPVSSETAVVVLQPACP